MCEKNICVNFAMGSNVSHRMSFVFIALRSSLSKQRGLTQRTKSASCHPNRLESCTTSFAIHALFIDEAMQDERSEGAAAVRSDDLPFICIVCQHRAISAHPAELRCGGAANFVVWGGALTLVPARRVAAQIGSSWVFLNLALTTKCQTRAARRH